MRTQITILAAALCLAAPLAAQNNALAIGRGVRAEVRITATAVVPVFLQATETAALTQTHKGEGFTEYLATYTVRGNVRWTLDATAIPTGVTVLDQKGDWTDEFAAIGLGQRTNNATVLVRVRVADGTAEGWEQALRIEAQRQF
jgi:hypothetical protein